MKEKAGITDDGASVRMLGQTLSHHNNSTVERRVSPSRTTFVSDDDTFTSADISEYPTIKKRKFSRHNFLAQEYSFMNHVRFGGLSWTVVIITSTTHVLLICDETIAEAPYHIDDSPVTLEKCILRKWLNNVFFA